MIRLLPTYGKLQKLSKLAHLSALKGTDLKFGVQLAVQKLSRLENIMVLEPA